VEIDVRSFRILTLLVVSGARANFPQHLIVVANIVEVHVSESARQTISPFEILPTISLPFVNLSITAPFFWKALLSIGSTQRITRPALNEAYRDITTSNQACHVSTQGTHPREVFEKGGMNRRRVPHVVFNHVYDPDNRARTTLRQTAQR
jgi:hypothetical protein